MAEFTTESDDTFSPAEQAQFDAMRTGSPPPEAPAREPEAAPDLAPEPEAAAADEPQTGEGDDPEGEETEGEGEAGGNRGQYVRREALRQERDRRKGLQKELAEAREQRARLDERLRIFAEASKAAQPQAQVAQQLPADEDPEPNPEEDIFAHNRWIARQISKSNETAKQQREQAEARERADTTLNSYRADVAQFVAKEPAFNDAYQHLYRSRALELQHAGMTDKNQILAAIARDELDIAAQALQQGVSPAERIFQIAQARGFVPKAPEPAPEAKPAADTAAQKAERAAAGQRGPGRSLSSVGGAPAGGLPTVEQLANMSEEDFSRFAKKNPGAVTALMGG